MPNQYGDKVMKFDIVYPNSPPGYMKGNLKSALPCQKVLSILCIRICSLNVEFRKYRTGLISKHDLRGLHMAQSR